MADNKLDPRIIKISFDVNGKTKTYSTPFFITVSGVKYANALQNQASVIIANLDKATQDYILTETTPFNYNNNPKTITIEAGRQSYGTSIVYTGNIALSNVTQPPDVGIVLTCLTGNFEKTNVIGTSQGGQATLLQITTNLAQLSNQILNYQATNKNIANYSFGGSASDQIKLLNSMGGVNVFEDNGVLYVKDSNKALINAVKIVSASTGMIGVPEFTEQGAKAKFLYDNNVLLGGTMRLKSSLYPAVNGDYIMYKLAFELSTRETPFYYIAEGQRINNQ